MEGERCKTIASIFLRLLLGAIQKDATTELPIRALRITNEAQTNVGIGVFNYPKQG